MKVLTTRSAQNASRLAATQTYKLLGDQLFIFVRAWGSTDYNQKFVDEIQHYMASSQADIEVTTPFDFQENLTSLANRTRVALLLAHDLFYKNENKNSYSVGFEALVLCHEKNELAWSSVGRFSIDKIFKNQLTSLLHYGSDLDAEVLLPAALLGVEREAPIISGSARGVTDTRLVTFSPFQCRPEYNLSAEAVESLVDVKNNEGSYWFSVLDVG